MVASQIRGCAARGHAMLDTTVTIQTLKLNCIGPRTGDRAPGAAGIGSDINNG